MFASDVDKLGFESLSCSVDLNSLEVLFSGNGPRYALEFWNLKKKFGSVMNCLA